MKFQKQEIPFTMVANEVLYRRDISLKAKGLFSYLFSKPDGWDFAADRIASECKETRNTIQAVLRELETARLLLREKQSSGRVEYVLKYAEEPESQEGGLFVVPDAATVPDEVLAEINPIIAMFEKVNPSCDRLFSNGTQRKAVERMLRKHGKEFVENAIRAAIDAFGKDYAPTITTPLQLEMRMGSLGAYLKRTKGAGERVMSL